MIACKRGRIASGSRHHGGRRARDLAQRHVNFIRGGHVQAERLDVADDADDFGADFQLRSAQQYFTDRRFSRKHTLRECLVDHGDVRRTSAIGRSEASPGRQSDAQHAEIVLGDDIQLRKWPLREREDRPALDLVRRSRRKPGHRQANRRRRAGDPRGGLQRLDDAAIEVCLLIRRRIARSRQADHRAGAAGRVETRRRAL